MYLFVILKFCFYLIHWFFSLSLVLKTSISRNLVGNISLKHWAVQKDFPHNSIFLFSLLLIFLISKSLSEIRYKYESKSVIFPRHVLQSVYRLADHALINSGKKYVIGWELNPRLALPRGALFHWATDAFAIELLTFLGLTNQSQTGNSNNKKTAFLFINTFDYVYIGIFKYFAQSFTQNAKKKA